MAAHALIPDELARFLESGLSIVIATRNGDLEPDGTGAWAVQVHADRAHLTLFLHEQAAEAMLANLESHPEIAIDLDQPTTHRACQVKGRYRSSRRARKAERGEVDRQADAFVADLASIGIPPVMTSGWKRWPCRALEIEVTELFEQTPGPGTGEPLT